MSLKANLVRQFVRRLSPQDVLNLTGEAVRAWMSRMPVEENLGAALQGLDREDRDTLPKIRPSKKGGM